MFAEVILPLPLYSSFTYLIPPEMEENISIGSRVLVQFGRKKFYTGIVSLIHNEKRDYEIKPITEILDPTPVLRYPQLKLWRWISEYYLCSEGEVMKAAIPTGLKPESETFVALNDDFDMPEGFSISDKEALVMSALQHNGRMRISDLENELKLKNTARIVSHLLDAEIIQIDERVVERYRPHTEYFVSLALERGDEAGIHALFDAVKRSPKQEKMLLTYLDMSGWLQTNKPLKDVKRSDLLESTGLNPGILRALIDKNILVNEKRVINRFNPQTSSHEPVLSALSDIQRTAYDRVLGGFKDGKPVLLHGVTGSGKTEIYAHLIAAALRDGNQVLYLVPEISLTTQLADRLRAMFGDALLVYHSKFSDNERVDIWKRLMHSNDPVVVLGVRSSVFLPF